MSDGKIYGPSIHTAGFIRAWEISREKEEKYRETYGYKKNDQVNVYTLPKGKKGKLCSFSWTPMTPKARRLQESVYVMKGKITSVEYSNLSPKEKAKKLRYMRCQLNYLTSRLNTEVEASPKVAVIVEEES